MTSSLPPVRTLSNPARGTLKNPGLQVEDQQQTQVRTVTGSFSAPPSKDVGGSTRVLLVFAVVASALAFCILVLNVVTVGGGARIYSNNVHGFCQRFGTGAANKLLDKLGDMSSLEKVNFYPGIWFGVLELIACLAGFVFCSRARREIMANSLFTYSTAVHVSGVLLTVYFALLSAVAIAAVFLSSVTAVGLAIARSEELPQCISVDHDNAFCFYKSLIVTGATCNQAGGMLYRVYAAIAAFSALLAVMNIVISGLLCGALCCCRPAPRQEADIQTTTVVTTTSGAEPTQRYVYGENQAAKSIINNVV